MRSKIIISLLGLLLLTSVCFAEITPELAEFDKNFCALAAKEDKTPEEWAKFNQRPPYSENKEITGDYNKELAVKCVNGTFVGKKLNHINTWQGVPFAQPPVGKLRWRAAQAPKKSDKIFEAYNYGNVAIQNPEFELMTSKGKMDEDCLNLNIWVNSQSENTKKPVLFWIHGGGFCYGSGSEYNGFDFVKNNPDILVVTINYRLGIMAINNFKDLEGGKNAPYQCGFTDQIQALKWVKENIAGFGGDPDNIIICGESAGSSFCSSLCISPKAKGLFKKAICFSTGVNAGINEPKDCLKMRANLMKEFNAKTFYDLQNIPVEDIHKFWNKQHDDICYFPYGDEYMPKHPLQAYKDGDSKDIIMMQGNTKNEITLFFSGWGFKSMDTYNKYLEVLMENSVGNSDEKSLKIFKDYVKELKKLGFKKEEIPLEYVNDFHFVNSINYQIEEHANNGGNGYVFNFHKEFASPKFFKAAHTIDYVYLFDQFNGKTVLGNKEDVALALELQKMVANFCKNGNPSTDTNKWLPYTNDNRMTMIINDKCELVKDYQRARVEKSLKLFESSKSVQKLGTFYPYWREIKPQLVIDDVYNK